MKFLKLAALLILPCLAAPVFATTPLVGVDFEVLQTPKKIDGKIEVREFFSYACNACYKQALALKPLVDNLPNDVQFKRTPLPSANGLGSEVKLYLTLEAMPSGSEKAHFIFLEESAKKGGSALTPKAISTSLTVSRVNLGKFNGYYSSIAIHRAENEAKFLVNHYKITDTPAVIVNGKYIVKGAPNNVLTTVKYLVEQERNKASKPR